MDLYWQERNPHAARCIDRETGRIVALVQGIFDDAWVVTTSEGTEPVATFIDAAHAKAWVRVNVSSLLKTFKV